MKQLVIMLTIVVLATTASFGQSYTVLDSILTVDRKLKGAYQIKRSSYDLLKKLISQEKMSTDTITHKEAVLKLYSDIETAVNTYELEYLVVNEIEITDSVYQEWLLEYQVLNEWINKVTNDPDIQEATTMSEYKRKLARRNKLLGYHKQIQGQIN
jgi:hypothetical protein